MSIPLEIAIHLDAETPATVTVFSFYDGLDDEFDPDVADLPFSVVELDANSRFDVGAYRTLRRHLVEGDFDVLHTHHNSTGSMARVAAIGTDTAIVDTEHNDHRHFSVIQVLANAATLPLADVVVSNSESTRDSFPWYERAMIGRGKNRVVYNGIDPERIDAGRDDAHGVDLPDGLRIVTVGSLTAQKDQATLVRAMDRVAAHRSDASLVVVGAGPLEDDLRTLSDRLGVADAVYFTGYLPTREDVYAVLDDCDVFAVSSRYEGFCVAAVEAMACGLPVVASDLRVLREVLGDCARYAPVGDDEAFADRLSALLDNHGERERLGAAARERALDRFPIDRTACDYFDVYGRVVEGRTA